MFPQRVTLFQFLWTSGASSQRATLFQFLCTVGASPRGRNFVSIPLYVWCFSPGEELCFNSFVCLLSGASPRGRNFVPIENGDEVSDLRPVLTHLSLHGLIPKRKSRRMQHAFFSHLKKRLSRVQLCFLVLDNLV